MVGHTYSYHQINCVCMLTVSTICGRALPKCSSIRFRFVCMLRWCVFVCMARNYTYSRTSYECARTRYFGWCGVIVGDWDTLNPVFEYVMRN